MTPEPSDPIPAPSAAPRYPSLQLTGAIAAPAIKLSLIGLLSLILLVPMWMVSSQIRERQERQAGVLSEFKASWGPDQTFAGPVLIVPYRLDSPGSGTAKLERRLHIAPSHVTVTVRLSPEIRSRGLFHALVYGAEVTVSGSFVVPHDLPVSLPTADLAWRDSFLAMRATDLRGLKADAAISWNGQALPWVGCNQGGDLACGLQAFVVARPPDGALPALDVPIRFETHLQLRGTDAFWLAPLGRDVELKVMAPWPTPSFVGALLPANSTVTDQGFEASWRIASNVATGAWLWAAPASFEPNYGGNLPDALARRVGVELLEAVPTYRMVERSSKYDMLFLALAFVTYFLFEVVSRVRIHLVQYGLLGLSIALFALLLISLSEPLGFVAGYGISAALVVLQASLYTAVTTRRPRYGGLFAAVLTVLFGLVYVLLSLETYSLLTGALALFVGLSLVMAVTRRVDWSRLQAGT
jgi:inner membrane protein